MATKTRIVDEKIAIVFQIPDWNTTEIDGETVCLSSTQECLEVLLVRDKRGVWVQKNSQLWKLGDDSWFEFSDDELRRLAAKTL